MRAGSTMTLDRVEKAIERALSSTDADAALVRYFMANTDSINFTDQPPDKASWVTRLCYAGCVKAVRLLKKRGAPFVHPGRFPRAVVSARAADLYGSISSAGKMSADELIEICQNAEYDEVALATLHKYASKVDYRPIRVEDKQRISQAACRRGFYWTFRFLYHHYLCISLTPDCAYYLEGDFGGNQRIVDFLVANRQLKADRVFQNLVDPKRFSRSTGYLDSSVLKRVVTDVSDEDVSAFLKGHDRRINFEHTEAGQDSLLAVACRRRLMQTVKYLLAKNAPYTHSGYFPYDNCPFGGSLEILKLLLEHGKIKPDQVFVNAAGSDAWTPLAAVLARGDLDMASLLRLYEAKWFYRWGGLRGQHEYRHVLAPLLARISHKPFDDLKANASCLKFIAVLEFLLGYAPTLLDQPVCQTVTADGVVEKKQGVLHHATTRSPNLLLILLAYGANLRECDHHGKTVLEAMEGEDRVSYGGQSDYAKHLSSAAAVKTEDIPSFWQGVITPSQCYALHKLPAEIRNRIMCYLIATSSHPRLQMMLFYVACDFLRKDSRLPPRQSRYHGGRLEALASSSAGEEKSEPASPKCS